MAQRNSMTHKFAALLFTLSSFSGVVHAENIDATLQWAQRVTLSTPVSGVVKEIVADQGASVSAGEAIIRLDPRTFEANLAKANAEMVRSENAMNEAKRELERYQDMFDRTLIAEHDLELAKIAAANSEAEYEAAKAGLAQAQYELDYSVVHAPFDGIVIERHVDVGQTIITRQQAVPMALFVERGRMAAHGGTSLQQIKKLSNGQAVNVRVDGKNHDATISRLALEPDSKGLYGITVIFSTEDSDYRVGQPATIKLP